MKILLITDTHIGCRGGSNTFRQLFREYYEQVLFPYIEQNDIDCVVHGGDFFDNRSSLSLADIDYVCNELTQLIKNSQIPFYIIVGNHDTHYKNTNKINSLTLLKSVENVVIVEDQLVTLETGNKKFVLCPWINVENQDGLIESLKYVADDDHILVGHFEIKNCLMYKNSIPCDHGLEPSTFKDFHKVLSGHFHHSSQYGNIEYIGALFHYNWEDAGDWRGFTVYDSVTDTYEKVENEFCLFTAVNYEEAKDYDQTKLIDMMQEQFVRVYVSEKYDPLEFKQFKLMCEKANPLQLDIIDNTVFEINTTDVEKINIENVIKEPVEYAKKMTDDADVLTVFSEIYKTVLENRKDVI